MNRARAFAVVLVAAVTVPAVSAGAQSTRAPVRPLSWAQQAELTAFDGASHDGFGTAVAISGKTAIVSAPGHEVPGLGQSGAAYVFVATPSGWVEQAELTPPSTGSNYNFGAAVAISGNVAVVGEVDAGIHTLSGAYVFVRSHGVWKSTARLQPSDCGCKGFAASVAISGDTIAVGAPPYSPRTSGLAFIYRLIGGHWTAQGSVSDGVSSDNFGISVSVDAGTVLVGAPGPPSLNPIVGSAHVYTYNGSAWVEQTTLHAADPAVGDNFGCSVSISGTTAMVGAMSYANPAAPGAAYVFTNPGTGWSQQAALTDGVPDNFFGSQVAISGTRALVGINPGSRGGKGPVYLYGFDGSTWAMRARLRASDGGNDDQFGQALAISTRNVIVGAYNHAVGGNASAGAAYVFAR